MLEPGLVHGLAGTRLLRARAAQRGFATTTARGILSRVARRYRALQARSRLTPSRVAYLVTQLILWGASNSQRQVAPSSDAALYFASCRIDDS
jgi:hypothetical protein